MTDASSFRVFTCCSTTGRIVRGARRNSATTPSSSSGESWIGPNWKRGSKHVWRRQNGELIRSNRWQTNVWRSRQSPCPWSPDGATLAAAAVGGPITLCDGQTGRIKHLLPGHEFGTAALSWSPQGTLLASSGQDGKVRLWNPVDGTEDRVLEAGASWVDAGLPGVGRERCLPPLRGKKVLLWNSTGQLVQEYANHPSTVADIQWKPETEELASASYGQIALFHPDQAKPVRTLSWKGLRTLVLAWSPDGNYIATGRSGLHGSFLDCQDGRRPHDVGLSHQGSGTLLGLLEPFPGDRRRFHAVCVGRFREGTGRKETNSVRGTQGQSDGPFVSALGTTSRLGRG